MIITMSLNTSSVISGCSIIKDTILLYLLVSEYSFKHIGYSLIVTLSTLSFATLPVL